MFTGPLREVEMATLLGLDTVAKTVERVPCQVCAHLGRRHVRQASGEEGLLQRLRRGPAHGSLNASVVQQFKVLELQLKQLKSTTNKIFIKIEN